MNDQRNATIDSALDGARAVYLERRPKTIQAHAEAGEVMPGGNTRTVLYHGPVPLRIAGGEGAHITDVDGHRYLNLLGEYTAGIYGQSNPVIQATVIEALKNGVNLSAHNSYEARLARLVCDRFTSIDLVRFTNSGTEANLMAISTARAFTGRSKVLVMRDGYHGGLLYFGGGGIAINAPYPFVLGRFNDVEFTRAVIAEHRADLACILVEPMIGSGGCIPALPGFLEMLREQASQTGALLIFDEVMTSRFAGGGAQGLFDIAPDMTTLGKYIGGGMTAGAFGGRRDIMAMYDPGKAGFTPHAGTFNNNTLTMAAGIAGLGEVFTPDAAAQLHRRGEQLRQRINACFSAHGARFQATGIGSLIGLHATRDPIRAPEDKAGADDRLLELLFLDLLEAGFYVARRGFIALALPVSDDDLEAFVAALDEILIVRQAVFS